MTSNRQQHYAVLAALRQGSVAIFPTESSYAIGCRINSPAGIRKILQLKGRSDDRFTVVASSIAQVQKFFSLTKVQRRFVRQYWPGAISLVVSKRFAVRVPSNQRLRRLAQSAQAPLVATSLNQSGKPPLFDLARLPNVFHGLPQENIGKLANNNPSTVVNVTTDQSGNIKVVIVRAGQVRL